MKIPTSKRDILNMFLLHCKDHPIPDWPGTCEFRVKTWDDRSIFGWFHQQESHTSGSLLMLHGFMDNSGNDQYWRQGRRLADKHRLALAACDFRGHGKSDEDIPTFGKAESWDLKAVLDEAEKQQLPRPYVLFGQSLGGMAAQVCAIDDARVDAAILIAPPAWPWHAIDHVVGNTIRHTELLPESLREPVKKMGLGLSTWIADLYKDRTGNVLHEGSLFHYEANPEHEPLVLYVMGDKDEYDVNRTHQVWDHWYKGQDAVYNAGPRSAPDQSKWMVEIEGHGHPGVERPDPYEWEGFDNLIDEFIETALERKVLGA